MNHRMVLWRMNEQDKRALMVICSQFSHLGGIKQQLLKAWEQAEHTETTTGREAMVAAVVDLGDGLSMNIDLTDEGETIYWFDHSRNRIEGEK
jgi:hypothetical protein